MTTRPTIHLSSLVSPENPTLQRLREFPPPRKYELIQHPENADFILFVESGYFGLEICSRLHQLQKQWQAQLLVFSESDWPFPLLPGLYPSLTKRTSWAHSWSFLVADQPTIEPNERTYLFSFLGRSSTHPVRREILNFDSKTTPCVDLSEAHTKFAGWNFSETYVQLLSQSKFVLCPRGIGASSIRLFEAMRAGCVPVIISDDWIEPPCGDWKSFSIRIHENEVRSIPDVCASRSADAREMGELAAKTYKEHFAPDVFLDNAVDCIREHSTSTPQSMIAKALRAVSVREFRSILSGMKSKTMALHRGTPS